MAAEAEAAVEEEAAPLVAQVKAEGRRLTDEELGAHLDSLQPFSGGMGFIPISGRDYHWERDFPDGYTEADVSVMLGRLTPRQVTYAAARVRGYTKVAAVELVQCTLETARSWERTPWFEPLLARERGLALGDTRAAFLALAPQALVHLDRALRGEFGAALAQDAAKYALDKVSAPPRPQRSEGEGEQGVLATLADVLREINRAQATSSGGVEEAEWRSAAAPSGSLPSTSGS